MSQKEKFVAELSQKLLGDLVKGTLAGGNQVDLPVLVGHAIKGAAMLFDSLAEHGYVSSDNVF